MVIDLSRRLHHRATQRALPKVNRPQALKTNHTYNTTPCQPGRGSRKYGKKFSKVIGNPALRSAGAGVIWNAV